ncbi:MAG: hypothetical protein SZ59_C0001G0058 [candidate division TM6 bacterium GW2011_GWF2_28_16]|jgi:cell division protein ZapA (FtsZ GTPase activity inhibitor)|nr:MAG: hypothetical protein SZ59_C0001G0058 [candidate division TM6 bacterium GW2011_GWF2_28_16]
MEKEFKKIQATIFGKSYTFATDENEQDILSDVAYVDGKMKEISSTMHVTDGYVSAVMLALQLVRELKQKDAHLDYVQQKVSDLGVLLDSETN